MTLLEGILLLCGLAFLILVLIALVETEPREQARTDTRNRARQTGRGL